MRETKSFFQQDGATAPYSE